MTSAVSRFPLSAFLTFLKSIFFPQQNAINLLIRTFPLFFLQDAIVMASRTAAFLTISDSKRRVAAACALIVSETPTDPTVSDVKRTFSVQHPKTLACLVSVTLWGQFNCSVGVMDNVSANLA